MITPYRQLIFYTLLSTLVLALLAIYSIAFGASLTPRPAEYTPVDYLSTGCAAPGTDTMIFRFGKDGDVRWIEIYVEDSPGYQQLVAVGAFGPGADGVLTFAEVLLPSGEVLHFSNRAELQESPYAEVCVVANLWLMRT